MNPPTVEEMLRERIGLDPDAAGPGLIGRAVRARMKAIGLAVDRRDDYAGLLRGSDAEFEALVEQVVVSESWFFRDERPFTFLADRLATAWLDDPQRPPLRILSIPCAAGEEPYSIAMALIDRGLSRSRIRVVGVDLSREALAQARRGVYTSNAFRSKDLGFRDRHFHSTPKGYEIDAPLKSAVEFRQGNLVDPAFLADEPRFDAVFCRNLLIYLDEPSRRRAFEHLDRLLAPDGLLFLGHAEHLGSLGGHFRPAGDAHCFAHQRSTRTERKGPAAGAGRPGRSTPTAVRPEVRKPSRIAPPRTGHTPVRPAAPTSGFEASRATGKAAAGSALKAAAALADQGRHSEAAGLCEEEIRSHGPSAPAFFLLGLIRQALGDRAQAERCFEKAVYLDPRHDEALAALSAAAQRRGDLAAAANYLRRAGRATGEGAP